MKTCSHLLLALLIFSGSSKVFASDLTTAYLIRHSEKNLKVKQDPPLTQTGLFRANNWAKVFKDIPLDAVYSTNTQRTLNTALPTAKQQNLEITLYSHTELNETGRFLMLNAHLGKSVLIVGHSNTIPALANSLVGTKQFSDMDESTDFASLFVVTINKDNAKAQRLQIPITDIGDTTTPPIDQ